jgi:hypothetical protein
MSRQTRFILLFPLVFAANLMQAQVNDAGLWLSANLEKKITPAFSACFTQEIRLNENITEVGTIYSDLGLSYQPWKRLKIAAAYRFLLKRRLDDTYQPMNSFYCEASYREKFKPIGLILRIRYQSRYAEAGTSEYSEIPKSNIRTKLTLKYDTDRKIEPYIYTEIYIRLNTPEGSFFNQLRACAGIEYKINRIHKVDLYYLIRKEFQVKNPLTDYIIGIGYFLTL